VLSSVEAEGEPREIPFDELIGVEIRPSQDPSGGRSTLVVKLRGGDSIELESNVDRWIVAHLLERLFAQGLGGTQRILVAVRLKPGSRERARELLRVGPPFQPDASRLVLHEVYLLEEEALFLFVSDEPTVFQTLAEPDLWAAVGAWRELIAGEIRLAERVYAWSRDADAVPEAHFGLGY
jgi:hypothetical protein